MLCVSDTMHVRNIGSVGIELTSATTNCSSLPQFMVGYDDSQLGAPEEEEEEEGDGEGEVGEDGDVGSGQVRGGAMVRSDYNKLLLESAVEEFERNFAHHLQQ